MSKNMVAYNFSAIRELLLEAFADYELTPFLQDNDIPVYKQFSSGMSKGDKIQLIIDHIKAKDAFDTFLARVNDANPNQYRAFAPRLMRPIVAGISDNQAEGSVAVKRLPLPLEKYDSFFEQFRSELNRWTGEAENLPIVILRGLAKGLGSKVAYIVLNTGGRWIPTLALDDRMRSDVEKVAMSPRFRELITQAMQYRETTYVVADDEFHGMLFKPFSNQSPQQILVFTEVQCDFSIDSALDVIIETILRVTDNLSSDRKVSAEVIELSVHNALRQLVGYVSLAMYDRQFSLFQQRLNEMIMVFEPIIKLHPVEPYIFGWEALARDPDTGQAPTDLFAIAELWGRKFQLELDMRFLEKAIDSYVRMSGRKETDNSAVTNSQAITNKKRRRDTKRNRRNEEIQPLSVNVYPESLIRTRYRETIQRLYAEGDMPMNLLTLEISEKQALPRPEVTLPGQDPIEWFRSFLTRIEQFEVRFAIDDFGVGYASSSRLSRLRPARVKIDRDALLDRFGEFTFNYVIDFAQNVPGHIEVVVEGYDLASRFPLSDLFARGIRLVQGHALATPVPAIDRLDEDTQDKIVNALKSDPI